MSIEGGYTIAVQYSVKQLLAEAEHLSNETHDPNGTYVSIELNKAKASTLTTLCKKVDAEARGEIGTLLEKAQRKLTRAEQFNCFLRDPSESAIDPRVDRILGKVVQKEEEILPKLPDELSKLHTKLLKWNERLIQCACRSFNALTNQQIVKGRALIREIDMQVLNIAPQFITFEYSLVSKDNDKYYPDLPNPEECKKMASAFYAMKYLEIALETEDQRFDQRGIGWMQESAVHQHTAEFIQKHPPRQGISAEALFEEKINLFLQAVTPPEFLLKELTFPSDTKKEEIQKKLENLIDWKNVRHFKSMGAFIEVPPQMLALVFHASGRISLVNPCGWPDTQESYEANFANARQAANFLSQLISEMKTTQPIALKPYCHKWAIDEEKLQSEEHEPPIPIYHSPFVEPRILIDVSPAADRLNRIIELLSKNSEEGFLHALTYIEDVKNHTAIFSMSDQSEQGVFDRCCFHLYHIQDKETPDKVDRNDHNWGLTAFQTEGLSTPEQKLRAMQRTQVELLFNLINQTNDYESIRLLFDALEPLKLHANDLPKGQNNPGHALFGKLYENYVETRKQHRYMEDPQHEKFRGEFGRVVFRGDIDGILLPPFVMTNALQEVEQAFKAAWRI